MSPSELPLTFEIGPTGSQGVSAVADPGVASDPALLARNLNALGQRQPALARALAALDAPSPLRFERTEEEGALTADLDGRALASRRRPLTEASRLASKVDIETHGALLILGMGLGHHVSALAQRAGEACALVVFEPDLALLRAVFERVDHSAWLAMRQSAIVTDPDNVGAMSSDLQGLEALLSVGIELVEHAPNAARIGDGAQRIITTLKGTVGAMRMHVITAMVQADVTARNELMNLGHYVARPGISELEGLCAGRPAILVAAGPSLKKSIDLLKDPRVRERCVIICVQTVLKPLLEAGITPHFVTAIDYHEISKRFYEGLTEQDVRGVTLIAEARANAAILDAFPGDIRLPRDDFLDALLQTGPEHGGPDRGKLTAAATVAHLSYYLARYMGADPVVLVGQDLAFTDGQYYGPNAAIHNVWACELNEFNTLETLEWQRIVRNKGHLHRVQDVLGRPVFTDDQMAAYLAQFERDFAPDEARGLRIIDASEGVKKHHTAPMTLEAALRAIDEGHSAPLPDIPKAQTQDTPKARRDTADLLRRVRSQTKTIARKASECVRILGELQSVQQNTQKNGELVRRTHALREDAQAQQPAFHLIMKMNQLGGFKRFKADRAIALAKHEDPLAEQRARIERDKVNLKWIEEYAGVFEELLSVSERALQGGAKRTRDITPRDEEGGDIAVRTKTRVGAILHTDLGSGNADHLRKTCEQLLRAKNIDKIIVLTPEPARWAGLPEGIVVERSEPIDTVARRALRAGRAFALDNWRGGLAGLSVFDEVIAPGAMADACVRHNVRSLYCAGPDWIAIDPGLTDEVIGRHLEAPEAQPIVFTQAPPGVCGAVVSAEALREIADGRTKARGSMFATLGGVLGYIPLAPRSDPIAGAMCLQIDERLRDRAVRTIADIGGAHTELVLHAHAMGIDEAKAHIDAFAEIQGGTLLSLIDAPLDRVAPLIEYAKRAGLLTHVRTHLRDGTEGLLTADIVSIDCISAQEETYAKLTGTDAFMRVQEGIEHMLEHRSLAGGFPTTWVVPRIAKRDDVYEELEAFYDLWLTRAGAAVIDPLPAPISGERIAPLPVPGVARQRLEGRRMVIGQRGMA